MLLPPSEGKASGGSGCWDPQSGGFCALARQRAEVIHALHEVMGDDAAAAKLLNVKGRALTVARTTNLALPDSPSLPAASRYCGVVWEHLSPATLSPRARRRARAAGVIVSGLLGVVRFNDPVPDYKLKMGSRLPGLGLLSTFWRPVVTTALAERCRGSRVFDLLPAEHSRALDIISLEPAELVTVEFRTPSGKAVGHEAKAAKGAFVRHLFEGDDVLGSAGTFAWGGWASVVRREGRRRATVTVSRSAQG